MSKLKVGRILCYFGFHAWEITKWSVYKDAKCRRLDEEGFDRTCERCDKKQSLQKPEKYDPVKYVWRNKLTF